MSCVSGASFLLGVTPPQKLIPMNFIFLGLTKQLVVAGGGHGVVWPTFAAAVAAIAAFLTSVK